LAPLFVERNIDLFGARNAVYLLVSKQMKDIVVKVNCSPVNSSHPDKSKLGGEQPLSPGARSNPSLGNRRDGIPAQLSGGNVARHSDPEQATTKVTGPGD
jgi:hypothetical protein